jgi:hypothetical protein
MGSDRWHPTTPVFSHEIPISSVNKGRDMLFITSNVPPFLQKKLKEKQVE